MNLRKRLACTVLTCVAVFCCSLLVVSLPGQLAVFPRATLDECTLAERLPWESRSRSALYADYIKPSRINLEFVGEGFLHTNCCGRPNATAYKQIDPLDYLPNSKTPCWYNSTDQLNCIPYFFMVGVFKCGTTDLFRRITRHPEVLMGLKEIHWFSKMRRYGSEYQWQWYLDQFAPLSAQIEQQLKSSTGESNLVIGEGSVSYFSDSHMWPDIFGNEFCAEPRLTVASHIHHLNPKAKIIISLRNPTSRLYSKYLFSAKSSELFKNPSPQQFHQYVGKSVRMYTACMETMSVRACAYNHTLARKTKLMLHEGMYSVFLEDWFRIFPREQIYIVRMEDYSPDMPGELAKIYKFLDLSPLSRDKLDEIADMSIINFGKNYDVGLMINKSYWMLNQFYQPFNDRLARLLKDEKWAWKKD